MTEWILSSSILILIVIALRTCFKGKISLRLQYAIWGLVLLRLLIPVSFGSTDFSVANLAEEITPEPVPSISATTDLTVPERLPEEMLDHVFVEKGTPVVIHVDDSLDIAAVLENAVPIIWVVGFVSVAGLFLFTNLRFKRKIMVSRYGLDARKNKLDVYVTDEIDTPCLFGIINPAIYVTYPVAEDDTLLRHTLEHEATHHRHGDHIWAVLRCVCLAIHWYNPLVWWAAFLSQRDAELACDEDTIKQLGEGERAEYGRTLIGMTCQRRANVLITATTMTASKSGIKERILLIAKKPKMAIYTLVVVVLIAAIAVGCTFTGAKPDEPEIETEYTETKKDNGGARGEILDRNGALIIVKDLEGVTTPTESFEATGLPDDAPPVNLPDVFTTELDDNKVCIAVLPIGISVEGGDYRYIIPENQEVLLEYYTAANAAAHAYTKWDNSNLRSGWWIVYQDMWWQVTESGAMFGIDNATFDGVCIDADDARELYKFCDAEVKAAGIGEPVRPGDITELKSATLYWNGIHTITDEYALNKIETWFSNSRESGSVSCWFTAQLVVELENGETRTVTMATDDCAYYMTEGVAYGFGEITEEGINGNEEFYSLFAPSVIHEKSKEGMDAVNEYMIYLNWSRYANQYGVDETFALMDMIEKWAAEDPTYNRFGGAIGWSTGLDGAYADYYAGMLARLYELAPSEFAWACLGNATDANEQNTLELLAYNWNITTEQARAKLEAEIPQN